MSALRGHSTLDKHFVGLVVEVKYMQQSRDCETLKLFRGLWPSIFQKNYQIEKIFIGAKFARLHTMLFRIKSLLRVDKEGQSPQSYQTRRKSVLQIYDVPMKFARKLMGGQCTFVIYLCDCLCML